MRIELAVQDDAGQIDYDTVVIAVVEPAPVPSMHPTLLYVLLPSLLVGAGPVMLRRHRGGAG